MENTKRNVKFMLCYINSNSNPYLNDKKCKFSNDINFLNIIIKIPKTNEFESDIAIPWAVWFGSTRKEVHLVSDQSQGISSHEPTFQQKQRKFKSEIHY